MDKLYLELGKLHIGITEAQDYINHLQKIIQVKDLEIKELKNRLGISTNDGQGEGKDSK